MAATPLVLDALVLEHLSERFPEAAQALRKELEIKQAELPQPALVAAQQRQALLTLLSSKRAGEPMWAAAYAELRDWIDGAIDVYKPELQRVLYPLFAYTYLELLQAGERAHAGDFFERFHSDHALAHRPELNLLSQVNNAEQLRVNEYSRRLLRQRYEVVLSSFSRSLLFGFIEERQLHMTLRIINSHVRLRVPTLSPPNSISAAAANNRAAAAGRSEDTISAEAAEVEAHGGALLWAQVDVKELAKYNATEVNWAPLPELQKKHRELLHQLRQKQGLASADEPPPPDPKETKRKGKKPGGGGAPAEGDADRVKRDAIVPRLPLPPFNMRIEKDFVRDSARRARLVSGTPPPSALAWTIVDATPPATLCAMAFSNDGASAACGHADGAVRVCLMKQAAAAAAARKKQRLKQRATQSAAESGKDPSGTGGEASAGRGGGAEGGDAPNGEASAADAAPASATEIETEIAARVSEAELESTFVLIGHSGPVYGVGWSRDDKFIISGSQDGNARLWSVLQRACIVRYHAHAGACWSVAFSPVGANFATTGADRTVRVWGVSLLTPLRLLLGHASDVTCVTFHPAGAMVASGGDDAAVRVWDVSSAKCLRLLVAHGHAAAIRALAFAPEGAQLASSGDDRAVLLWDLASASLLRRFRLHTKPVWTVGFSAEGAQLVSAGLDCMVGVWDVCGLVEGSPPPMGASPVAAANGRGSVEGVVGDASDGDHTDPRLVQVIFTKFTPVVAAAYTRTNVLYVGGAFQPPAGYEQRLLKQKRGRSELKGVHA